MQRRNKLEYPTGALSGAGYGAILGVVVCFCSVGSQNGVGSWFGTLFICALIGFLVGLFVVYMHNKEIDEADAAARREQERKREAARRAEEVERQRQELESWKRTMEPAIDNIFEQTQKPSKQKLNNIYKLLPSQGEQPERVSFIIQKLLSQFDEIEEWTFEELSVRDFASAVMGLKIMSLLKKNDIQYKNAYTLLEKPESLMVSMQDHGLSKDSQYISDFLSR